MPFRALLDGEVVWPDQVANGTYVQCIGCGEHLTTVRDHKRGGHPVARHFRHLNEDSCSGGETNIHKLMKYVASRALIQTFSDGEVERESAVPDTNRVGDVVMSFPEPKPVIGKGVVAEVQYKNTQKHRLSVTTEYLDSGYSVVWLGMDDFSNDWRRVKIDDVVTVWPHGVPNAETWPGYASGVEFLNGLSPSMYPIDAKLPEEFIEENEQVWKAAWSNGSGEFEFDIEKELDPSNASRSCAICGNSADYYLIQWGTFSEFRCKNHHPNKATSA